jgi:PAS domain S-box-containing protein
VPPVDNLDDFFHLLPVALYRTASDGRLFAANQALAELLGYESTSELMEQGVDVEAYYVDPSVRTRWVADIEGNGLVEELDFQLTRNDGTTIWVRDTARVARDADGNVLYFEGALVDVSDKIRLLRSRDEFIATVSHELRNPISVALGLSREMTDSYESFEETERRKMVELIARESEEAAWLIEDLLVAHRDEHRDLSLSPLAFAVKQEVDRIAGSIDPPVKVTEAVTTMVHADPGRTRQIVRNLISNAQRYGGANVEVEIGVEDSWAAVRVCDDGDRIDEDIVSKIFEPFGQDHRRSHPNSVGIGLSVSRKLARLMGGDVEYQYEANRSCFVLHLPQG